MFDPRPLCCSSLTTAVGGTKDTNIVDSESPYRGTNQAVGLSSAQAQSFDKNVHEIEEGWNVLMI